MTETHTDRSRLIQLDVKNEEIFNTRRTHSEAKISSLQSALSKSTPLDRFPSVTVFAAGSYARYEASPHSDIDLFFVCSRPRSELDGDSNIRQLRLMADIVRIGDEHGFPKFSNDGQYLNVSYLEDIINNLGGVLDDYENHFTLRMLLLLEGCCLYGHDVFSTVLSETVSSYFRDYPKHELEFKPTFLLNDILRFWKTLCLNYENKRNVRTEDEIKNTKNRVRNFKLKFSRLMTCFASIAYLMTREEVTPQVVRAMTELTPCDRLRLVGTEVSESAVSVKKALLLYEDFLKETSVTEETLLSRFGSKNHRVEAFRAAREFGDQMFEVVRSVDGQGKLIRYLVI